MNVLTMTMQRFVFQQVSYIVCQQERESECVTQKISAPGPLIVVMPANMLQKLMLTITAAFLKLHCIEVILQYRVPPPPS